MSASFQIRLQGVKNKTKPINQPNKNKTTQQQNNHQGRGDASACLCVPLGPCAFKEGRTVGFAARLSTTSAGEKM